MDYVAIPKEAALSSQSDLSYRKHIVATISSQRHKNIPDQHPQEEENNNVAQIRQMSIPTVSRPNDYNFGGDPTL